MSVILQILLLPFPWNIRRFLLVKLLGYKISPSSHIGFSLVLARKIIMEDGANIGSLSLCNKIDLLHLGHKAKIGSLNYITGYTASAKKFFSHIPNRKCELIVKEHSAITSRHYLDCTAGIYIGRFTTFAGVRSQILTHSIDLKECQQDAAPVHIGDYCFIGTGCIFLKGSEFPHYSILGAGSLMNKSYQETGCLYGGVPARKISSLNVNDFKYFSRETGYVL